MGWGVGAGASSVSVTVDPASVRDPATGLWDFTVMPSVTLVASPDSSTYCTT
ncbi:hypothetical protein CMMCAS04_14505 [Clavibacter michiganensis subsp. michiganensis]|nr:hypothetical protein CMMCAS04_14505 [Clavibacter michiganensis subsp. michiganensis]